MKGDRFLQFILIGIAAVAILAVAVFLIRKNNAPAVDDSTPRGVIEAYAAAIFTRDYDKAYSYLADAPDKPDLARFRQAFLSKQVDPSTASLQITQETVDGDRAYLSLTMVHTSQGLFDDVYRDSQNAELVRQDGAWKIRSLPYPYWNYDWYQPAPNPLPATPLP